VEPQLALGDLGYTNGVQFDLDEYNGRQCVTPEFSDLSTWLLPCTN
jgi:hypothetical protein